jgi:hypothetical protein
VLLHFINKKGYTYEIQNDIKDDDYHKKLTIKKKDNGVKKGKIKNDMINNIINAKNITSEKLSELIKKNNSDNITKEEKYCIEKYIYKMKFNLNDDITFDTMKKIYGKIYMINNYCKFMGINTDDVNDNLLDKNDSDDDLTEDIKYKKILLLQKIINILGFNITDGEIVNMRVEKEDFNDNKIIVAKTITEEFKLLFKMKKSSKDYLNNILLNVGKNKDNKKFLGFVNGLLQGYGVRIVMKQKRVRIKKKFINIYIYKLEQNDQVKIYYKKYK